MNRYELLAFVIMPLFVIAFGSVFSIVGVWLIEREDRRQKPR